MIKTNTPRVRSLDSPSSMVLPRAYSGQVGTSRDKSGQVKKIICGFVFFALVLFNFSSAQAAFSSGTIISLTNSARAQSGLGALTTSSALTSAAYAKGNDMLSGDYFAHTSPEGTTPWDFIRQSGYTYAYAGENLAIGYSDANELFSAWMNSQTHRDNILSPNFREIGVAVVTGEYEGTETIVVVQEFGAALESTAEVSAATPTPTPQVTTGGESQGVTATPASESTAHEANFEIVKEKSSFKPQTIFAQEEVQFQVVLSGEVQTLEIQVADKKINLLEVTAITRNDSQATYSTKAKIEKEGKFDVIVVAADKSGTRKSENLGKLTVQKIVITKNTQGEESPTLFAGFKQTLKENWVVYSAVLGGVILAVLGLVIFRKYKFAKMIFSAWRF